MRGVWSWSGMRSITSHRSVTMHVALNATHVDLSCRSKHTFFIIVIETVTDLPRCYVNHCLLHRGKLDMTAYLLRGCIVKSWPVWSAAMEESGTGQESVSVLTDRVWARCRMASPRPGGLGAVKTLLRCDWGGGRRARRRGDGGGRVGRECCACC